MKVHVGQGGPDKIPSSFFTRGTNTPNLVIVFMMKFTKLTFVALKIRQGEPHTIPSRFSMRGTYTANLMNPVDILDELLW